jgi:microcompartment protein CcmK/EutM
VKWPAAKGLKLLLVRPYQLGDLDPAAKALAPLDELVVAADLLDAGPGDDVLVAFGHAARVAVAQAMGPGQKPDAPVDAAVVAVVDRVELQGDGGAGRR